MSIGLTIVGITNSFAIGDILERVFQLMVFGWSTVKWVQRELGKACGKTLQLLLPNSGVVRTCVYRGLNKGLRLSLKRTNKLANPSCRLALKNENKKKPNAN